MFDAMNSNLTSGLIMNSLGRMVYTGFTRRPGGRPGPCVGNEKANVKTLEGEITESHPSSEAENQQSTSEEEWGTRRKGARETAADERMA
jgi:hypothetical protein